MDNNCRLKEFFNNLVYSRYGRAITTLVIGFRQKSTHHRGNLWRRKTYRPLIALIDNHSKDAARFWGSALFSFQFLPLGTQPPVNGQMVYEAALSLSFFFCWLDPVYPARLYSCLSGSFTSSSSFSFVIALADYERSLWLNMSMFGLAYTSACNAVNASARFRGFATFFSHPSWFTQKFFKKNILYILSRSHEFLLRFFIQLLLKI